MHQGGVPEPKSPGLVRAHPGMVLTLFRPAGAGTFWGTLIPEFAVLTPGYYLRPLRGQGD